MPISQPDLIAGGVRAWN